MEQFLEKKSCIQKTIKGSRFLAYGYPCSSKDEIDAQLKAIRREHSGANHHCYGWRLAIGEEGYSDDGEPRGSAGMPILKRLSSLSCVDTLIVVVRYFGGTKLGVGGLVRAYGGTAQSLLEESVLLPYQRFVMFSFSCGYEQLSLVEHILSGYTHIILKREFLEVIAFELKILEGEHVKLQEELYTRTKGTITNMKLIP